MTIKRLFVSQSDLAGFVNLSTRRVRDLEARGVFSRDRNKKYDLQKSNHAFISYLKEQMEGTGNVSLTDVRIRKEAAKAALTELDLQERKANLVPKDRAMEWLSLLVGTAKAHLWGLSKRLAGPMAIFTDPKEAEELMRLEIRTVLEDMGKPLKRGKGEKK
jgi:hypothetical protein